LKKKETKNTKQQQQKKNVINNFLNGGSPPQVKRALLPSHFGKSYYQFSLHPFVNEMPLINHLLQLIN